MFWWSTAQWKTRFNHNEKTIEVGDIMITSVRILLAGVFLPLLHLEEGIHLLPLHLDDVIYLGVVTHIEAVKHLNVTTISTAYHNPADIEDRSK